MRKILCVCLFLLTNQLVFSQSTSVSKVVENVNSTLSNFIIHVNNVESNIVSIEIQHFLNTDSSPLMVFSGKITLSELDSSPFYSFKKTNNTYEFGIGQFENGTYSTKIILGKTLGLPVTYDIN